MRMPVSKTLLSILFLAAMFAAQSAYAEDVGQKAQTDNAQAEGAKIADLLETRTRAAYQRQLKDLITMFPEYIVQPFSCYQAAISNYVEDQWNRIGKSENSSDPFGWAANAAYFKYTMPVTEYLRTDSEMNSFKGQSPETTSNESPIDRVNKAMEKHKLPPISLEELTARLEEVNKYMASCNSMKPRAWSIVGSSFASPPDMTVTALKIGAYYILIQSLLTYHLPEDKKGYVGCIVALFPAIDTSKDDPCQQDKKCIEEIPADTKDSLFSQLDELKTHQCSFTYAHEMMRRK
jgi:hypothetical protein